MSCSDTVDSGGHDEGRGDVNGQAGLDGDDVCCALTVDLQGFAFLLVYVDGFGVAEDVRFGVSSCDGLVT